MLSLFIQKLPTQYHIMSAYGPEAAMCDVSLRAEFEVLLSQLKVICFMNCFIGACQQTQGVHVFMSRNLATCPLHIFLIVDFRVFYLPYRIRSHAPQVVLQRHQLLRSCPFHLLSIIQNLHQLLHQSKIFRKQMSFKVCCS